MGVALRFAADRGGRGGQWVSRIGGAAWTMASYLVVPVLVTRADTAPLNDLFARVVVIGDDAAPDAATRARVEVLVTAHGGQIAASEALAACGTDVIANATLVAVATPRGRSHWGLSDIVTDALGHCAHPVLFIPAP